MKGCVLVSMYIITEGTCTIDLTPNNDAGKMDISLICPSCNLPETTLDIEDCDIYSDLNVNRGKETATSNNLKDVGLFIIM